MTHWAGITDIARNFAVGLEHGADFMIMATDSFDYQHYPVYVHTSRGDTTMATIDQIEAHGDRVREIYDLALPVDAQLHQKRAWNDEYQQQRVITREC